MDFRLINKTREWMNQNNLIGDADVVSIAGSSKALVDGNKEIQEFILKQINISYNLHNARKVILLHHSDCGAYKADYDFIDSEAEIAQQLEDMCAAEEIIKNSFEEIDVKKIWAQMKDPHGEDVEFSEL
jgi:carbonic anhydrase